MILHILYTVIGIITVFLICSLSASITIGLISLRYKLKKKYIKFDMAFAIVICMITFLVLMNFIGETVYTRFLQNLL